jgi:hypothetical protein
VQLAVLVAHEAWSSVSSAANLHGDPISTHHHVHGTADACFGPQKSKSVPLLKEAGYLFHSQQCIVENNNDEAQR